MECQVRVSSSTVRLPILTSR